MEANDLIGIIMVIGIVITLLGFLYGAHQKKGA